MNLIENVELRAELAFVANYHLGVPVGGHSGRKLLPALLRFLNLIFDETNQRHIRSETRLQSVEIDSKGVVLTGFQHVSSGYTESYRWHLPLSLLNSAKAQALWQTAALAAAEQLVTETELAVVAAKDHLARTQQAAFKATETYRRLKEEQVTKASNLDLLDNVLAEAHHQLTKYRNPSEYAISKARSRVVPVLEAVGHSVGALELTHVSCTCDCWFVGFGGSRTAPGIMLKVPFSVTRSTDPVSEAKAYQANRENVLDFADGSALAALSRAIEQSHQLSEARAQGSKLV